jgi:hypothetical protein
LPFFFSFLLKLKLKFLIKKIDFFFCTPQLRYVPMNMQLLGYSISIVLSIIPLSPNSIFLLCGM